MIQEKIIKLLSGASKVAKESGEIIKHNSANYIEQNIIKGKYVSREEYDQLKNLVLKLEKDVNNLLAKSKK